MDDVTLDRLIRSEIASINATLAAHRVDAGTHPTGAWTTIAGTSYISYGLRLGQTQTIDGIERRLPELQNRIGKNRRDFGLSGATTVMLRRTPALALEVPHPQPRPLAWQRARLKLPSMTMLTGRVYEGDGARDDTISLHRHPHTLIAGMSNSGKSTLARMMLASLAINTHPDDLQIVIIDMKRSDLFALRGLPQVIRCAYEAMDAARAVRQVEHILRTRIEREISEPKLLLAIDELRELVRQPGVVDALGSIVSLGRSLGIHVLAATQHPKAGEIGSIVKANFAVRLVGQVAGARLAEAAADRPDTGAELLPGAGAFLRIDGSPITRLQAYFLDDAGVASMVDLAHRTYAGAAKPVFAPPAPVRTGAESPFAPPASAEQALSAPVRTGAAHVQFPLPRRAPTPDEANAIRELRLQLGSLNQTILAAYGSKSSDTHRWVSEALTTPEPAPILRMGGAR